MMEWHYATLLETADAIRSRKISPVELTNALLGRIARLEPSLHSYATVTLELACAQARRAEAEIAARRYRGPLQGIPVAVKDICNTAGVVTAAGMTIHANYVPDFDATVVKRLADATREAEAATPEGRRSGWLRPSVSDSSSAGQCGCACPLP